MSFFQKIYLEHVHQEPNLSPYLRREEIINYMSQNDNKDINCSQCIGNCCTFTSNSMQITPLEAIELLIYLKDKKNLDLKKITLEMKKTIEEYRLDQSPYSFQNKSIRKTYTCPFYKNCKEGCSISPAYKPYGCLAFNPVSPFVKEGKDCRSNIDLLEKRDQKFSSEESRLNNNLKEKLNISWFKLPIPMAILEIIKAEENLLP